MVKPYDEIKQHQDCRYVGPSESCHRLFSFPLHGAQPPVIRLQIHLPNEQSVYYEEGTEEFIVDPNNQAPTSQLLEYFNAVKESKEPNHTIKANLNYLLAKDLTYDEMPAHYTYDPTSKKWKCRKVSQGRYVAIGRIYTISPSGGQRQELYFLRTLLTKRIGMSSFEELRTYEGIIYNSFQDCCRAMGLLQDDMEWIRCLQEAAEVMTNIHQLRELFVVILFFNVPADPSKLWERFKDELSEDFKYRRVESLMRPYQGMHGNGFAVEMKIDDGYSQDDYDRALYDIEDILSLPQYSKSLDSYFLPHPVKSREDLLNQDQDFQNYDDNGYNDSSIINIVAEDQLFQSNLQSMNTEQEAVTQQLLSSIQHLNNKQLPKCFFIDAPGGTGKTYVLNSFIHYARSKELKVICTAYSGIAANLLIGGRTCHSQFRLPLNPNAQSSTSSSTMKATEAIGKELAAADIIIIDEASMLHKKYLEIIHSTLLELYKAFHSNSDNFNTPFAGKLMILSGDFRQVLPIVKYGDRSSIVETVLNRSHLWHHFKKLELLTNERVMRNALNQSEEYKTDCQQFSQFLLRLGSGQLPFVNETFQTVELSHMLSVKLHTEQSLINFVRWCYPELDSNRQQNNDSSSIISIQDRGILCPLNEDVDEINQTALDLMQGECHTFLSADKVQETEGEGDVPEEYLNSLLIPGIPHHKLELKIGTPIILLRNLDPKNGLCNGTKLIISRILSQFVIAAKIVSGTHSGKECFLPRINFTTTENEFPFILTRRQFPIRLAFAITINKAQGQSLKRVGIYLRKPVFSHGQLYVALSRAGVPYETKVLIHNVGLQQTKTKVNERTVYTTSNIVWKEVF